LLKPAADGFGGLLASMRASHETREMDGHAGEVFAWRKGIVLELGLWLRKLRESRGRRSRSDTR